MKKFSVTLCCVLAVAMALQCHARQKSDDLLNVFAKRTAKIDKDKRLRYREVLTAPADTIAPAIVIYLHGGSGVGEDNERQMRSGAIAVIYNYLIENNINAYFLVPQCDEDASWSGYNPPPRRGTRPSLGPRSQEPVRCPSFNKYVKQLADYYISQCGADSTRVYVFGASMGGDGVWHLLFDYPHYFAAAMAASGGYRGDGLSNLSHTPLLCTKGTKERRYHEYVRTIEDLLLLGADVNFQPLQDLDHHAATDEAFTPDRVEWVLSHRRQP